MSSPTQRTLAELRRQGYEAHVVERWIPGAGIRVDWGGWMDVLAVGHPHGILGIQTCSDAHHAARVAKCTSGEVGASVARWKAAGGRAEVWSWGLRGARGARKTYQLRVTVL